MSSDSESSGPEDRNLPKGKKRPKPSSSTEKLDKSKGNKSGKSAKDDKGNKGDKGKKDTATKRKRESDEEDDDDDDGKVPIGSKRFISVSEFRGKKLIDIREWYGDDDDMKPGKKGISLSIDQFEKVLAVGQKVLDKAKQDD